LSSAERQPDANVEYVTVDDVDAALTRRSQRLSDWFARNPYVPQLLANLPPATPAGPTKLAPLLPTPMEPAPMDFRILRIMHLFYGLPANEEPYDLLKIFRHGYDPMVEGGSADEVMQEIKRDGLKTTWSYAPAERAGGVAIASGGVSTGPERSFDGRLDTFWISPERGTDVKGHAWIGYSFAIPRAINRVRLIQTNGPAIRQDRVMIQASRDGGTTWTNELPEPAILFDEDTSIINLGETRPARDWRILAAGDNATRPEDAWAPLEIEFFVRQARQ
jgi:hypothetical protein